MAKLNLCLSLKPIFWGKGRYIKTPIHATKPSLADYIKSITPDSADLHARIDDCMDPHSNLIGEGFMVHA